MYVSLERISADALIKVRHLPIKTATVAIKTGKYTAQMGFQQAKFTIERHMPEITEKNPNFQEKANKYMAFHVYRLTSLNMKMKLYTKLYPMWRGYQVSAIGFRYAQSKFYDIRSKSNYGRSIDRLKYEKAKAKQARAMGAFKNSLKKDLHRIEQKAFTGYRLALNEIERSGFRITSGSNIENKIGQKTVRASFTAGRYGKKIAKKPLAKGGKVAWNSWKNRRKILYSVKHPIRTAIRLANILLAFMTTVISNMFSIIIVIIIVILSLIITMLMTYVIDWIIASTRKEPACVAFQQPGTLCQDAGFVMVDKEQYRQAQYSARSLIFDQSHGKVKEDQDGLSYVKYAGENWYLAEVAPYYSKHSGEMLEVILENGKTIHIMNVKNSSSKECVLRNGSLFQLIGNKDDENIQRDISERKKWDSKVTQIRLGTGQEECFDKYYINANGTESSDAMTFWGEIYDDLESNHLSHLNGEWKYQCVEFVNWCVLKEYGFGIQGATGNGNEMYRYAAAKMPNIFKESDIPVKHGIVSLDFGDPYGHVAYIEDVKALGDQVFEVTVSHGNTRVNEDGKYFRSPNPYGSTIIFNDKFRVKNKHIISGSWTGKKVSGYAAPIEEVE